MQDLYMEHSVEGEMQVLAYAWAWPAEAVHAQMQWLGIVGNAL